MTIMTDKESSAASVLKRFRSLPELFCKICKRHMGYAEHADVNMGICDECGLWYNRELFKMKRLPRLMEYETVTDDGLK